MTSCKTIIEDMRRNPRNVAFDDAVKVAKAFFGDPVVKGSHHRFRMPWPGDPRINLQRGKDGKAKPYQIRQLLNALDRLEDADGPLRG